MGESRSVVKFVPRVRGSSLAKHGDRNGLNDRGVVAHIERIRECHAEFERINHELKNILTLPTNRLKRLIKSTLGAILPKRAQKLLPQAVKLAIIEDYDALEVIESLQKTNINNTQEALRELAACAIQTRDELDNLGVVVETAKTENWDAQELQAYMAERAGIEIYGEINQLLDKEFSALTEEDKEKRKEELLTQIQNNVVMGQALMETMGKVCGAALQIFHRAVSQYVDYVHVYRPVAVIRDAAKAMIETNHSNFMAKEAIAVTFTNSLEAIKLSLDTAEMVEKYSITAPDMQSLLASGRRELTERLAKLQNARVEPLSLEGS